MEFIGVMGLIGLIGFRVEGRPTPLFDVGLLYLTSSSKETKYLVLAAGGAVALAGVIAGTSVWGLGFEGSNLLIKP